MLALDAPFATLIGAFLPSRASSPPSDSESELSLESVDPARPHLFVGLEDGPAEPSLGFLARGVEAGGLGLRLSGMRSTGIAGVDASTGFGFGFGGGARLLNVASVCFY